MLWTTNKPDKDGIWLWRFIDNPYPATQPNFEMIGVVRVQNNVTRVKTLTSSENEVWDMDVWYRTCVILDKPFIEFRYIEE